jgi:uncharacterized protein (TIGR02147 family)
MEPTQKGTLLSEISDYRDLLKLEFAARHARNFRFSLRAFASRIAISPGRLSEILRGKQHLSADSARRIAVRLNWSETQMQYFCTLVELTAGRSELLRELARKKLAQLRENPAFRLIYVQTHVPVERRNEQEPTQ